MKTILLTVIILTCMSCGKDKIIQLPEISHSEITAVMDVSAAYLFYDETQPDSVELNRRNLISTTNWLINVDKRLTLKQVIPHIQFLQEKKRNSSHKNEHVRNYFTCHDLSQNNLGFIDFTNITYQESFKENIASKILNTKDSLNIKAINFNLDGIIYILNPNTEPFVTESNKYQLIDDLKKGDSTGYILSFRFNKNLSFQDYITYKSLILDAEINHATISNKEFLDN
ncbi:hypothetical protein VOI54_10705 [Tamlana sp. 2201CG12-4]|uniref:hypothetical protein n=1 Tax=Tamlana sp. 2201CG12-4 TaxID=3112582 RepID=UPI002DB8F32A|nr:hypothetical protein [Tamlana sp. 2201CG12-4]MEC3907490.1 hypothetical protein [Tamlana sp. 2201CG12-4]